MKNWMILLILLVFSHPFRADAAILRPTELKIWKEDSPATSFEALKTRSAIGGSVAITKSKDQRLIIVGSGLSMEPTVSVFTPAGKKIRQFGVFEKKMKFGVNLAVGDLDNDGEPEIVVAPKYGGRGQIRIFTLAGQAKNIFPLNSFTTNTLDVYEPNFASGLQLAVGDVNADGRSEIITATGPGVVTEAKVITNKGEIIQTFKIFGDDHKAGAVVAATDLNRDGSADLIFGEASLGSRIREYLGPTFKEATREFQSLGAKFVGGVTISAGNINEHSDPEILVSSAGDGEPLATLSNTKGNLYKQWKLYETDYIGGSATAIGDLDGDGVSEIVSLPIAPIFWHERSNNKLLEVSLDEQRLYAWENGYLGRTFLISSGLKKTPTPVGDFSILTKPLFVNYTRIYGPDDPRNYDFPNTRYNLMFKKSYYIHTAWWHNNFGHPMSHGCLNSYIDDAEWVYNWAPIGTPVKVHREVTGLATVSNLNSSSAKTSSNLTR